MSSVTRTHQRPPDVNVAYLLRSFPRLSQTFILSEVLMLEAQGIGIRILSLADPGEPIIQPNVARLHASITYLDELVPTTRRQMLLLHLHLCSRRPVRYLRALGCLLAGSREHRSGYSTYSGLRCFSFAACAATQLVKRHRGSERIHHIHAHFAHDPTFVAMLVHLLTGVSYSFTTHARDLFQTDKGSLVRRAAKATHVITCCRPNRDYLDSTLPNRLRSRIRLIHHGVDPRTFHPVESSEPKDPGEPLRVVVVARLVHKKGLSDLVRACGVVAAHGHRFTCAIYGEGPKRTELTSLIESLGLGCCVRLMGSCTQHDLVGIYQKADIFALTPFVTDDGDRDGIPNVLMEAMASSLPVLVTNAGGISELVSHAANGLVVTPRDVNGIAAALETLLQDADLRGRLGAAARETITDGFDAWAQIGEVATIFRKVRSDVT
jgi:glycosyltransferase involved in cell wall biosynthesis